MTFDRILFTEVGVVECELHRLKTLQFGSHVWTYWEHQPGFQNQTQLQYCSFLVKIIYKY
jgi:hypothetical protein